MPPRRSVPNVSFGFRKSLKLGPVRLTASKRGLSASTGPRPCQADPQQPRPAYHDCAGAGYGAVLAQEQAVTAPRVRGPQVPAWLPLAIWPLVAVLALGGASIGGAVAVVCIVLAVAGSVVVSVLGAGHPPPGTPPTGEVGVAVPVVEAP